MTEKLIGLCGYAQAGKDTAAANMPGRTLRAEKAKERSAAWKKKNPEKNAEHRKRYQAKHADAIAAYQREYQREYYQRMKTEHPEKLKQKQKKRAEQFPKRRYLGFLLRELWREVDHDTVTTCIGAAIETALSCMRLGEP